jgi:hypothetical protein
MKSKATIIAIGLFWIIATIVGISLLGGIDRQYLQLWLQKMGMVFSFICLQFACYH